MTSLIRFSPTGDMRRMQREIDRLFDDFFPTRGRADEEAETATWTPRVARDSQTMRLEGNSWLVMTTLSPARQGSP